MAEFVRTLIPSARTKGERNRITPLSPETIDVSGAGQLTASGILPSDLGGSQPTLFAARIKLDNSDELRLPGGSQAQVAVYTEDVQIAGIPVMFLIRAHSWMRYVM